MKYTVKFTKKFTSGHLKGLSFDTELTHSDYDSALEHVKFIESHDSVPVKPCAGSSSYTCHNPKIFFNEDNYKEYEEFITDKMA